MNVVTMTTHLSLGMVVSKIVLTRMDHIIVNVGMDTLC